MELTGNAYSAFQTFLTPGSLDGISRALGVPVEKARAALSAAVPAIFDAIKQKTQTPNGAKKVVDAIHGSGLEQPLEGLAAMNAQSLDTQLNKGKDLLNGLVGEKAGDIASSVAATAGVNTPTAMNFVGLASTAVFSYIGSRVKTRGWSASALTGVLGAPAVSNAWARASDIRLGSQAWLWIGIALIVLALAWWWAASRRILIAQAPTAQAPAAVQTPVLPQVSDMNQVTVLSEISRFLEDGTGSLPATFSVADLGFEAGSAVLSADAQRFVAKFARLLNDYPDVRVRIEGHTDGTGNAAMNQDLALARAQAIRDGLATQGVDIDRVEAVGTGSNQPIADNDTEEGRQMNRRTDIQILAY
jgi:outer membrane protein OmpA-like peptidoglycan-associated protein